jgi:hypothetical protein
MSKTLGWALLVLALTAVSGCDVNSVRSDTLRRFPYGSKQSDVDAAIGSDALYTFDYMVDDHVYRYQTVHSGDIGRYFGLLFKDDVLVSMLSVSAQDGYWPKLRNCELFPFPKGLDSVGCMRSFTDRFATLGAAYPMDLTTPDEAQKARDRSEATGTVAEAAVVMAITFPVSIAVLPMMVVYASASSGAAPDPNKKIGIRLGEKYEDIRSFVEALPDNTRDVEGGNGSFYVPRDGRPSGFPLVAFGVQDGIVVWMEQDPRCACGGGTATCWLLNDTTNQPGMVYPKGHPGGVSQLR